MSSKGYKGSGSKAVTTTTRGSGGNAGNYQNSSQVTYSNKQTGSYARATATEKASAGEFHWKNGTSGNRSEYKQTETVRVGDKGGYTEIHNEQRVRNVTYHNNYGGKSVTNYGGSVSGAYGGQSGSYIGGSGAYGGQSGSYGGYDYDSDSDSDY